MNLYLRGRRWTTGHEMGDWETYNYLGGTNTGAWCSDTAGLRSAADVDSGVFGASMAVY